jgi:DNA-binding NarL/FixJ family response regulator
MPGMNGIAAAERLREMAPHVITVICSNCKRSDIEAQAISAGAAAFVDKMAPVDHLLNVIRQVAS